MKNPSSKGKYLIVIFAVCFACKKSDERVLLHSQLTNYRNELKSSINSERDYISEKVGGNKLYKKIFDSLNKINDDCEKSFEILRYGNEKKLLSFRNEFNSKYKLNLKFESYNTEGNVPDSTFNKLIEIDFLRLRKKFQEKYMHIQGCKMD